MTTFRLPNHLNENFHTVNMALLKKHVHLLQTLAKARPAMARAIIQKSDRELIRLLSEIAHNTLKGNVRLTNGQSSKLKRYRKQLHLLANKRASLTNKRKILQKGGILPVLVGAIAPLLAGLIGGLAS